MIILYVLLNSEVGPIEWFPSKDNKRGHITIQRFILLRIYIYIYTYDIMSFLLEIIIIKIHPKAKNRNNCSDWLDPAFFIQVVQSYG